MTGFHGMKKHGITISTHHEASLSLKFGEMLSLMVAIVFGIVTPLKPTVQLLNLFLTHVLCTWSFAFEEPEDYIMSIPPRNVKKDLDGGSMGVSQAMGGTPTWMVFVRENPNLKWMRTGGAPILGNPHIRKSMETGGKGGIGWMSETWRLINRSTYEPIQQYLGLSLFETWVSMANGRQKSPEYLHDGD